MLIDILRAIKRDRLLSRSRLASELKVSEDLIDQGVQQLIQMGYLIKEEMGQECVTSCGSCPYAASCGKTVFTSYRISDKGNLLLAREG